ncbi:MAG: non-canonical purine NTP pyrophosphatase [Anaerolineae bacterium]
MTISETARGTVEGRIGYTPGKGSEGFGYDAIFIPTGYRVPMSDMSFNEKNDLSHRGAAARALLPALQRIVEKNWGIEHPRVTANNAEECSGFAVTLELFVYCTVEADLVGWLERSCRRCPPRPTELQLPAGSGGRFSSTPFATNAVRTADSRPAAEIAADDPDLVVLAWLRKPGCAQDRDRAADGNDRTIGRVGYRQAVMTVEPEPAA